MLFYFKLEKIFFSNYLKYLNLMIDIEFIWKIFSFFNWNYENLFFFLWDFLFRVKATEEKIIIICILYKIMRKIIVRL
jgi:hypothetical protein